MFKVTAKRKKREKIWHKWIQMKQLTRFAGLDMRKLIPRQPIVDALLMKRRKCQRTANASKSTKQMPICFVWQHLNSAFRALHNMRWLHPSFSVVIPLSSIIFGANEFCIAHSSVRKRTGMRCISIEQKLVSFHLDAEIGRRERERDRCPVWRDASVTKGQSTHTAHVMLWMPMRNACSITTTCVCPVQSIFYDIRIRIRCRSENKTTATKWTIGKSHKLCVRCKIGSRQKAKGKRQIWFLSHRKCYWLLCVHVPKCRNENFDHLLWISNQNNNNNSSADVINDYTVDSRDWRVRLLLLSRYEQLQQQQSRIRRKEKYLVMIPRREKDRSSDADRYRSTVSNAFVFFIHSYRRGECFTALAN